MCVSIASRVKRYTRFVWYNAHIVHPITKKFLKKWYLEKKLSTWAIEKRFGMTRSRVYAALRLHDIPMRSIAQSHIRYRRSHFSGDELEKAYLIGFAIGDLRVRNHNGPKSETISIGCGSTQTAQISLFRNMFSNYGRVWQSRPNLRGAVNIEAWVDKSFSFLLPKQRSYSQYAKDPKLFFAFLAGFTDAEGSFFISANQARVSWGNYNTHVLGFIKNNLLKFGIETSKIVQDHLAGTVMGHGYVRNKNYHHLSCNRKVMIGELLGALEPYIRHENKRADMARLRKNLILRGVSP